MGRKRKITRKNKKHKSKRKYKRRKVKRKYTKKRKYKKRVKKGGGVIRPKNVEELQQKLNQYGISTDTWNKSSGNKSVEQLLKEIKSGDSILIEENGSIYRSVRVANVIVLSEDNEYRLIEQSHLNKQREIVKERGNNVLSEKMEPNETLTNAIIRGVREELGEKYSENIMFLDEERSNVKNIEKSSYSYPGLKAVYSFYEKTIKIPLLTLDFPPPESFVTEEKNSDGSFKRYIVWNWGINN
jgi:hypothetical protein